MREAYLYHWHSIDLDLKQIANGRFQWTYFIDRHYCIQDTSNLSIEDARANALRCAHRSIELLDTITSNGSGPGTIGSASRPRLAGCIRAASTATLIADSAERKRPGESSAPQ